MLLTPLLSTMLLSPLMTLLSPLTCSRLRCIQRDSTHSEDAIVRETKQYSGFTFTIMGKVF